MRRLLDFISIFFLLASPYLEAQNTFIKRYKNTNLPESGVAVCSLPNGNIVIVGQQSNGLTWQAPLIIIADSLGVQKYYFVDTACYACEVGDAITDARGYIYAVGSTYGKAGILKYDTLGNRIWEKKFYPFGIESAFSCIDIVNDSLIIAGGGESTDGAGGKAMLASFNEDGDTLWSIHLEYSPTTQILGIAHDSQYVYATGVFSDSVPPYFSAFYLRSTLDGKDVKYQKINAGRTWGYDIVPLAPDSILIGGRADIIWSNSYSFISLVDSLGNILETVGDSNYLFTQILKMELDRQSQTLYTLSFDTINILGTASSQARISAYNLPITNLQQPLWAKTVTGTTVTGTTYMGLQVMKDGTVLHTAMATINCPNCPYLLKTSANACTDIELCDTTFFSSFEEDDLIIRSKFFPNPLVGNYLNYELASDRVIYSVQVDLVDISGRTITVTNESQEDGGYLIKGRITFQYELTPGLYIQRFTVNNKYSVYGRFVKL